jgi:hypothetical protein
MDPLNVHRHLGRVSTTFFWVLLYAVQPEAQSWEPIADLKTADLLITK